MISMIISRTTLLTIALALAVLSGSASAVQGDWTTYTNMNVLSQLLLVGPQLWCATTGGVAILGTDDGSITKLNNVDGLGDNYLNTLTIDTSGAFWFGSQHGTLTKYRPQENDWRVYYLADRDGRRLRVKDLFMDGEQLWIGTDIGVSLFFIYKHGGEIKETYRRLGEPFAGEEDVEAVLVVDDRIWVGTEAGVATARKDDPNLLDYSRWTAFTSETSVGLSNDHILSIADREGEIVVGTEQGVFGFDPSDSSWHSLGLNLMVNDLKYANQTLYAATNQGLYEYDGQSWTHVTDSGLLSTYFNSVEINSSGTPWVGTNGQGIAAFGGSEWETYVITGPPANTFVDMEVDDEGNLWCAQDIFGASVFDGNTWTSLNSIPQIDGNLMKAVERDLQDNIWFSSWGGGVMKFDRNGTWIGYAEGNSPLRSALTDISYVVVNDIAVDDLGNRWFPNWGAVDSTRIVCSPALDETDWIVWYEGDGLTVSYMDRISAWGGHLYISTRDVGLVDYDYNWTLENKEDDRVTRYTSQDDHLSDNDVKCANMDKDGVLWAGTAVGLDKFDADFERFRAVQLPSPLGPQVNDIAVDERNNKWIATSDGLCTINSRGDFVNVFTTSNSKICGDNVLRLKIDEKTGDVWIGTDNGLSRFESGIGAPAQNLSQVRAFPNPFVIESGTELVTFDRLPYQAQVRVFTVAGDLVREIKQGDQWDGRNGSGELVASGVYLFYVQDQSGKSAVGKIAVIRR